MTKKQHGCFHMRVNGRSRFHGSPSPNRKPTLSLFIRPPLANNKKAQIWFCQTSTKVHMASVEQSVTARVRLRRRWHPENPKPGISRRRQAGCDYSFTGKKRRNEGGCSREKWSVCDAHNGPKVYRRGEIRQAWDFFVHWKKTRKLSERIRADVHFKLHTPENWCTGVSRTATAPRGLHLPPERGVRNENNRVVFHTVTQGHCIPSPMATGNRKTAARPLSGVNLTAGTGAGRRR